MKKVIAISSSILALFGAVVFMPSGCSMTQSNIISRYPLTDTGQPATISLNKGVDRLDAGYHYTMGLVFQEKGNHRLAIQEFKDAVAADPRHVKAYNAMGVSYDAQGRYREATQAYLAALENDMSLDYVFNNLGWSYLLQGRDNMAVASFQQALRLAPGNTRYLNNLGYALTRLGRYGEAFEVFEKAIGTAKAHRTIARLCFKDGKYAEAEKHFARASALEYRDPETEKAMKAAANLAEIHVYKVPKEPAPTEASEMQAAAPAPKAKAQTGSGLRTFPAGALQDAAVSEIRLTEVEAEVVTVATESEALVLADLEPPSISPTVPSAVTSNLSAIEEKAPVSESIAAPETKSENQPRVLLSMVRPKTEKTKTRIHIEVSNGNGVRHMARQVGTYLRPKGFVPMYLTNADHFNHEKTRIYYTKGYLQDAHRLADILPATPQMAEVETIQNGNAHISLLIGKDIVPVSRIFKKG